MDIDRDNTPPLVSVVVATYGGDRLDLLEEAVASILDQSYRHTELIVVLDGPVPAPMRDALDLRARTDARLHVLTLPENRGPACARNAGIAAAQGRYVALLDADDRAAPERIEKQLAFIEQTGADLAGSCYHVLGPDGAPGIEKQVPMTPEAVRRWMYLFNPIANSTVFARADVLKRHPYPEGCRSGTASFDGEDYALWVTLALEGYTLRNQPECLAALRPGPDFIQRRRGWAPFRTDLRTKLRTLPLYPWHKKPLVILAALTMAALRLLPAPCLACVYRLRDRMRFTS